MDANTFTDPVIVKYINEKFWPVKFNAESSEPIKINEQTYINPNPTAKRSTHQLAIALLNKRLNHRKRRETDCAICHANGVW